MEAEELETEAIAVAEVHKREATGDDGFKVEPTNSGTDNKSFPSEDKVELNGMETFNKEVRLGEKSAAIMEEWVKSRDIVAFTKSVRYGPTLVEMLLMAE